MLQNTWKPTGGEWLVYVGNLNYVAGILVAGYGAASCCGVVRSGMDSLDPVGGDTCMSPTRQLFECE